MSKWEPRFRTALDRDFNDQSLTLLVSDYFGPKHFQKIAPQGAGNFEYRLYLLMEEARMDGWLYELVAAARERRPRSAAIGAIAEEPGLAATGPRLSNLAINPTLEAVVQHNPKLSNPARFLEELARIEGQVCWVNIPGGGGTGFLVGPDLVLTNDHVIQPVRDGKARWQDVRSHFDYGQAADGTVLDKKKQTIVELHQEPLLFRRPPGESDWSPSVQEAASDVLGTRTSLCHNGRPHGIKARCSGHGAIPSVVPYGDPVFPQVPVVKVDERAAPDAEDTCYHGFALLRFNADVIDVSYIDEYRGHLL